MSNLNFGCYYEFCGKGFTTKYNLKRHINSVHLKIKDYLCELCGKTLVSKIALMEHNYSHEDIKPIKCPYIGCEQMFSRSSLLCSHKKTHDQSEEFIKPERSQHVKKNICDLPDISKQRKIYQIGKRIPLHHMLLD